MGLPIRRIARLHLVAARVQGFRGLGQVLLLKQPRLLADLLLDHLLPHALLDGLTPRQLLCDALAGVVGAVQRQILADRIALLVGHD